MQRQRIVRFVDIDETVFHTTAHIKIRAEDGTLQKELSNQQWNVYPRENIIAKTETADFAEFSSAQKFFDESIPVAPMVEMLREWSYEMRTDPKHFRDMVVFVTARGDFDDREKLLDAFRRQLICIDDKEHFYISRTGNLSPDTRINGIHLSVAQRKKVEYLHYLMAEMPAVAELYEDDPKNIQDFLELKKEMPAIEYRAFLVKDNTITQVEN